MLLSSCANNERGDKHETIFGFKNVDIKDTAARLIFEKGLVASQNKEHSKALKYFIKANSLYPKSPNINTSIANVYAELGKFDESYQFYEKAIGYDSLWTGAYSSYGIHLAYNNQPKKAIKILKTGLALQGISEKSKYYLLINLAVAYKENKEFLQSLKVIAQIRKEIPNHPNPAKLSKFEESVLQANRNPN